MNIARALSSSRERTGSSALGLNSKYDEPLHRVPKWAEDEEDPLKTAGGRAYGGLNGGAAGRHFRADLSAVEAVAELTDQALNAESALILKGNVTKVRHGNRFYSRACACINSYCYARVP